MKALTWYTPRAMRHGPVVDLDVDFMRLVVALFFFGFQKMGFGVAELLPRPFDIVTDVLDLGARLARLPVPAHIPFRGFRLRS